MSLVLVGDSVERPVNETAEFITNPDYEDVDLDHETPGILELIDRVSHRQLLYDSEHPLHKDRGRVSNAWKEVADGLVIGSSLKTPAWCKQKWKKLKDYYFRKKRESAKRSGDKRRPKITWPFYSAIAEIMKSCANENENTTSNFDEDPPHIQSIGSSEIEMQSDTNGVNEVDHGITSVNLDGSSTSNSLRKRSRKPSNDNEEANVKLLKLFENSCKQDAEEDHFGMMIAKRLRKLSPRSSRKAQMKMQEVLFKIEFPESDIESD